MLKRRLSWHHPAIYLIIIVALLVYLIVALFLRKNAVVEVGLCEKHLARRRQGVLVIWLLLLVGLAGFIMAMVAADATYLLAGLGFFLAAIVYGLIAVRVVVPSKIDDKFVWLKGVNRDYLDQLPQWPGWPV